MINFKVADKYFNMKRIKQPTLFLDKNRCLDNIDQMVQKARRHGLIFRPHFKTHQSAEIGNWFRAAGTDKIAVSSVRMAKYFARHGWKDITIAFPVNILEIDDINKLASEVRLNLLVESIFTTKLLTKYLNHGCGIFIEIDTGYYRSGVSYDEHEIISEILRLSGASPTMDFKGFLTHAGHAYDATSGNDITCIYEDTRVKMVKLKKHFSNDSDNVFISIGDTPSCSIIDDFQDIDEIRPGNFIFYDVEQAQLGSCKLEDIAVVLACPIVAKYPNRGELIIYGGAIHLSKDYIIQNNKKVYGYIAKLNELGWEPLGIENYVSSVSQEHGIIKASNKIINKYNPGDVIGILPAHSCLTANLMGKYQLLDGEIVLGKLM